MQDLAAATGALSSAPSDSWLTIGKIIRAHGVRGTLRVFLDAFSGILDFDNIETVALLDKQGMRQEFSVVAWHPVHDGMHLTLVDVVSREAAKELGGRHLQVSTRHIPPAEPGEFYIFELLGATVRAESGAVLGAIRQTLDNAGQPLLQIDGPTGERLLPLTDDVAPRFDRQTRCLTVRPPEGLWNLN